MTSIASINTFFFYIMHYMLSKSDGYRMGSTKQTHQVMQHGHYSNNNS